MRYTKRFGCHRETAGEHDDVHKESPFHIVPVKNLRKKVTGQDGYRSLIRLSSIG